MPRECDCPKRNRWYFGGVSAAMASAITHPIDLLKVQLQTQSTRRVSPLELSQNILREQGILGFYSGLSAATVRQLTATQTRFSVYEMGKNYLDAESLTSRILLATFAGVLGGILGVPASVVNTRMQNDLQLPPELRRNYKNVFDGLNRIYHEEGIRSLFIGGSTSIIRLVVLTIGQSVVYDQAKPLILKIPHFTDNLRTHLCTSIVAALSATVMTLPLDVVGIRFMSAKKGEYKNIMDVTVQTAREGPLAFFKGFVPTSLRLGPHTILIFVFMEQLRKHIGYTVKHSRCCGPEELMYF